MERTTETPYTPPAMGRRRHDPADFPAQFGAMRAKLGTQFEVAVLLDLQPHTVSRYERGITVPHPLTQQALLDAMATELKKRARRKPSAG